MAESKTKEICWIWIGSTRQRPDYYHNTALWHMLLQCYKARGGMGINYKYDQYCRK